MANGQRHVHPRIAVDFGIQRRQRRRVAGRFCSGDLARIEHVVERDHPAGPKQFQRRLVIAVIAGLVGVDEDQVERPLPAS
jgi:hypothetical protein